MKNKLMVLAVLFAVIPHSVMAQNFTANDTQLIVDVMELFNLYFNITEYPMPNLTTVEVPLTVINNPNSTCIVKVANLTAVFESNSSDTINFRVNISTYPPPQPTASMSLIKYLSESSQQVIGDCSSRMIQLEDVIRRYAVGCESEKNDAVRERNEYWEGRIGKKETRINDLEEENAELIAQSMVLGLVIVVILIGLVVYVAYELWSERENK